MSVESAIAKLIHVVKVTWMVFWRLAMMRTVLWMLPGKPTDAFGMIAPWGIAFVIVIVLNRSVYIWPLFRLIRGNDVFEVLDRRQEWRRKGAQWKAKKAGRNLYTQIKEKFSEADELRALPRVERASAKGIMTGLEAENLEGVKFTRNLTTHGTPGYGLGSSGLANAEAGAIGEMQFAKILDIVDVHGRRIWEDGFEPDNTLAKLIPNYWSLSIPSKESLTRPLSLYTPDQFDTDVDMCFLIGEDLYIVDIKRYRSGDVTYRPIGKELFIIDNPTGHLFKEPLKISGNMDMAYHRYEEFFKHTGLRKIHSYVVLVPAKNGAGKVQETKWGSRSTLVGIDDFLNMLCQLVEPMTRELEPYTSIAPANRRKELKSGVVIDNRLQKMLKR